MRVRVVRCADDGGYIRELWLTPSLARIETMTSVTEVWQVSSLRLDASYVYLVGLTHCAPVYVWERSVHLHISLYFTRI